MVNTDLYTAFAPRFRYAWVTELTMEAVLLQDNNGYLQKPSSTPTLEFGTVFIDGDMPISTSGAAPVLSNCKDFSVTSYNLSARPFHRVVPVAKFLAQTTNEHYVKTTTAGVLHTPFAASCLSVRSKDSTAND